jgi:nucleoside-diphosphate-sugar epimerase
MFFLWPGMKILLTGATGFIGSHFLNRALASGHNVLAIRRSSASKPRIQIQCQPDWLDRQLDELASSELEGCDVMVHLAAHSVQYPFDTISSCLHWNVIAALALFEQARMAGIRRFVVAGSCFEYGRSGDKYIAIPTDAPLEPTNSYAVSKATASIALRQWSEEHHLSLEILRVFHVYGEGESESRFWPKMRRAALAGDDFAMTAGNQVRDFLAVEDVAQMFLDRATSKSLIMPCNAIYNLGSGRPCTLLSFAQYWWGFWQATGRLLIGQVPYRENEVMSYVGGDSLLIVKENSLFSEPYYCP